MPTSFTKIALVVLALGMVTLGLYLDRNPPPGHYEARHLTDPKEILHELKQGNDRFVRSARVYSCDTAHDQQLRQETARGQHPFVSMLCCCDSRVCPEFVFDQRIGSIFEIRNAGNVIDEDVLASMEYAVEHLHVPVILIMGHKGCGAIKAVCDAQGAPLHAHLHDLQNHMSGLLSSIKEDRGSHDDAFYTRMSLENARQQAELLMKESHVIKEAVDQHHVTIIYGIYDMVSGQVDFYDRPASLSTGK